MMVIKSRSMRWAKHLALMGKIRNAHKTLVGKPEEKRRLGSHIYKWEVNIKINLIEVGVGFVNWFYLARDTDRLRAPVNTNPVP
jgi:hypothetical protein